MTKTKDRLLAYRLIASGHGLIDQKEAEVVKEIIGPDWAYRVGMDTDLEPYKNFDRTIRFRNRRSRDTFENLYILGGGFYEYELCFGACDMVTKLKVFNERDGGLLIGQSPIHPWDRLSALNIGDVGRMMLANEVLDCQDIAKRVYPDHDAVKAFTMAHSVSY